MGERLRKADALGAVDEREDLGDEDVGERVHDGVEHVVDEDHGHDGGGGGARMRARSWLAGARASSRRAWMAATL